MQGYYGVSSLESLSQGKPVIAGLDEWNRKNIRDFFSTEDLPWISARNTIELSTVLATLIENRALREKKGKEARKFMEVFWNEQMIVDDLIDFYERL